jgi:hypothetical protein
VVKRIKYIFIGLKKDLFGCFKIEEIREKYNERDLKEGGGIEILTTFALFTITIITFYYSDTINTLKLEIKHFYDNYNLV